MCASCSFEKGPTIREQTYGFTTRAILFHLNTHCIPDLWVLAEYCHHWGAILNAGNVTANDVTWK